MTVLLVAAEATLGIALTAMWLGLLEATAAAITIAATVALVIWTLS